MKTTPTPGLWEAVHLVTPEEKIMNRKDMLDYLEKCIAQGAETGFYGVLSKEEGTDICHTGNGPTSPANAHQIMVLHNAMEGYDHNKLPNLLEALEELQEVEDQGTLLLSIAKVCILFNAMKLKS